jgi:hypothetical protein
MVEIIINIRLFQSITSRPSETLQIPPISTGQLKSTATTTNSPEAASQLKSTATTTNSPEPASQLESTATTTLKPKTTKRPHKGRGRHGNTKNKRKR